MEGWFPKGTYNKLKYEKIGHCKILRKFLHNPYKLDLLEAFDISPIFDVVDLYEFQGADHGEVGTVEDWKDND